jgi:hypothetical protein
MRLDERGLIPVRRSDGTLSLHIQTDSGARPSLYPMGNGSLTPGVERWEREADHSPPSSAEVKKGWSYTSTPHFVFVLFKHRGNFTSKSVRLVVILG